MANPNLEFEVARILFKIFFWINIKYNRPDRPIVLFLSYMKNDSFCAQKYSLFDLFYNNVGRRSGQLSTKYCQNFLA